MRKFVVAAIAAGFATLALSAPLRAEDTTVIRKDDGLGDHKTIIKKHEDHTFTAPRSEKKVIIEHN